GEWSARLGLAGRPAVAEELAVGREIALARLTGASIHLQQVSTAGAVALIRAAKAEAVPVTAEVSPHHLVLTEAVLAGFDPTTKLDPPLRTEADVVALRAAVADGTIDAIATAHAPHTVDAVERPFDAAPFGAIGLETALAALLTESGLGLEQLLPALSWQPASIAGIADRHGTEIAEGSPANLTVVDPDATWTVEPARFGGYAANSPLTGRELRGRVRHTVRSGEPVVVDGEAIR
ncbi:MAG: amidohydrolase family protein, partial [Actinomycetota bacterium]